ncbi:MAG: hypothetical protein AB7H97_08670 [Pseudobdellovibrionaceae bacterium]
MKNLINALMVLTAAFTLTSTALADNVPQNLKVEIYALKITTDTHVKQMKIVAGLTSQYKADLDAAGFFSKNSVKNRYCKIVNATVATSFLIFAEGLKKLSPAGRDYLESINQQSGGALERSLHAIVPNGKTIMAYCHDPAVLYNAAQLAVNNAQVAVDLIPGYSL